MTRLDAIWDELFPAEQTRIVATMMNDARGLFERALTASAA